MYKYDQVNRLISEKALDKQCELVAQYDYTYYLNDINGSLTQVLAELDKDGNAKCWYTRGIELLSQQRGTEISIYITDGHGSVRVLTDMSGAVTDTYTYDAWGNLISSTGDTENSYLYCGEQLDSTTGLYYLRARYMNPSTGTFISMDTYQGSLFDPVSLHKYLYANANPVMNTDPTGYFTLADCSTASAINDILDDSSAESYYPNDHGKPVHLHVSGPGNNKTKIGPNGIPLDGFPDLTPQQAKVVERNLSSIAKVFKKIQKWVRIQPY